MARMLLTMALLLMVVGMCPADKALGQPPVEGRRTEEPAKLPELAPPPTAAPALPECGDPVWSCAPCERWTRLHQLFLRESQNAATACRMHLVPNEAPGCVSGFTIDWQEQKQTVTVLELKPREVEQCVTCTKWEHAEQVDPCTGCVKKVRRCVPYTKTLTVTMYDLVPTTREVVVRVPCLKPTSNEVILRRLCLEETQEAVIEKRFSVHETCDSLKVPSCPVQVCPCPTPCPHP